MDNFTNFEKTWIGKGMQLNSTFSKDTGKIKYNSGSDRLHQSIYIILSTAKGERFMIPEFGSNLHKRIFEPNDFVLRDLIILDVKEALGVWEPRIEVLAVDVLSKKQGNTLPVSIRYRVKQTNMIDNYVYPFKLSGRALGGEEDYYE